MAEPPEGHDPRISVEVEEVDAARGLRGLAQDVGGARAGLDAPPEERDLRQAEPALFKQPPFDPAELHQTHARIEPAHGVTDQRRQAIAVRARHDRHHPHAAHLLREDAEARDEVAGEEAHAAAQRARKWSCGGR